MTIILNLLNSIITNLDSREIVTILIFTTISIFCIIYEKTRECIIQIFKLLTKFSLYFPIILSLIYILTIIYLLWKIDFWKIIYSTDTIIWIIMVSLPLFFNSEKITSEKNYFKTKIYENFKLSAFLGFLINSFTFNIIVEIILQVVLFFIVSLITVAKNYEDYKSAEKFLNSVLLIILIILFLFTLYNIYKNPIGFFQINTLVKYVLPIILTILYFPFLYLMELHNKYEIFYKVRLINLDKKSSKKQVFFKLFKECNFHLFRLDYYMKNFNGILIENEEDAINQIDNIKKQEI